MLEWFLQMNAGGINYPKGGVGKIAEVSSGIERLGGEIRYKANVIENSKDKKAVE